VAASFVSDNSHSRRSRYDHYHRDTRAPLPARERTRGVQGVEEARAGNGGGSSPVLKLLAWGGTATVLSYTVAAVSRYVVPPDPPHHERRVLFESLGISVVDFRCRSRVEPEGPEEPNPTHSVVLVRRGAFGRSRQRETILADSNHVLFFNAAEPYRYSHPLPGGDECTILAVETDRALELVGRYAPRDAEDPKRPFRGGHALSSRAVAGLHYELLGLIRQEVPALALEDALSELVDAAVRAAYGARTEETGHETASDGAARRRHDLVEAVKLVVNRRLEEPPRLGELARSLGCSPFHLSRTFRRTVGVSLRRYTKQLRARAAAHRLAGGATGLTELALDLGYADHSHFTNAFRSEWGIPPSRFHALVGRR